MESDKSWMDVCEKDVGDQVLWKLRTWMCNPEKLSEEEEEEETMF